MAKQPMDEAFSRGAGGDWIAPGGQALHTSPGRPVTGLTTKGTPRKRKPYRTRRDKGRFKLSTRDRWGMRFVADQHAVREDQLPQMFGLFHYLQALQQYKQQQAEGKAPPEPPTFAPLTLAATRSIIQRWVIHGYAVTDQPHKTDPVWLALTAKGMIEMNLPYEPGLPPRDDLLEDRHIYTVNQVRLKLMKTKTYSSYVWWSERAILANREEGASGVAYDHTPDAVLYLDGVKQIAVEIEITQKSDKRYDKILMGLMTDYPQVLYCVTDRLYNVLEAARSRLSTSQQQRLEILKL